MAEIHGDFRARCAHPTPGAHTHANVRLVGEIALGCQFHLRHSDLDGDKLTLLSELSLPEGRTVHSSLVWVRAGRAGSQVA